jgi:hypothetical protein
MMAWSMRRLAGTPDAICATVAGAGNAARAAALRPIIASPTRKACSKGYSRLR